MSDKPDLDEVTKKLQHTNTEKKNTLPTKKSKFIHVLVIVYFCLLQHFVDAFFAAFHASQNFMLFATVEYKIEFMTAITVKK